VGGPGCGDGCRADGGERREGSPMVVDRIVCSFVLAPGWGEDTTVGGPR